MTHAIRDAEAEYTNWRDFIRRKTEFYVSGQPRQRSDPGFPWEQIDKKLWAPSQEGATGSSGELLRSADAKLEVPHPTSARDKLRAAQQRHLKNFERVSLRLFEVRSLFEDGLSKHLFDETMIMRLAGHNNFFGPRVYFSNVANKESEAPFQHESLPRSYLGVPLVDMVVNFAYPGRSFKLNLIAPQGFDSSFNTNRQYFISRNGVDFFPKEGNVVFDCGACIGENSAIFAGFAGQSGRVHAFDPIPLHTRFCDLQSRRNAETFAPIEIVNSAVGKETKIAEGGLVEDIDSISPGGLQISNFNLTRLDDYVASRNITKVDIIKMDIEGAEPDALDGATHILQNLKPKLAISTYHGPDQFWIVPLKIKSINPDYRFFFEHHSPVRWESVVYAF